MLLSHENRTALILAVIGGVAAIDVLALNFLGPFVATALHLSNGQIGIVSAASQSAWAVGAICTALWSDRIGRRRIFLVGSMLGFALLSGAAAFATSFLTLLIARALTGVVEGPVVPMQNAIMHAESTPARRGVNMGIAQNFGSQLAGGMIAPLLLVGIATRWGWRDAFLVAGVPALLMAAAARWGLREPARLPVAQSEPLVRTIVALASVGNIRLCFVVGACGIGWWAGLTTFLPLWLVRQWHFTPGAMGGVLAWLGPSGALAAIVVPALSDRFGRRTLMTVFALSGVILPLAVLFGPAHPPALVASIVVVGWFFTGIFPLFIGIVPMESVAARHGATALAIVLAGAQITGSLVGPLLGGMLADRFSLAAPMWLSLALALGATVGGFFLRETAPAKLGAIAVPRWG